MSRRRGLAEIHHAALERACRGPRAAAPVWALLAADALLREPLRPWLLFGGRS